jgi:hypothetical protein
MYHPTRLAWKINDLQERLYANDFQFFLLI